MRAIKVMTRNNKFQVGFACSFGAIGVGVNDHAVANRGITSSTKALFPFYFNTAYTTSTNVTEILEIAQGWDRDVS